MSGDRGFIKSHCNRCYIQFSTNGLQNSSLCASLGCCHGTSTSRCPTWESPAPLLGLFRIQGTVFCTANGTVSVGGNAATPVFPNATVQLQCGAGNGVSTVTANASGVLVVTTPLATCNASLPPSGVLISALQFFGTTLIGALSVINVTPVGFTLQV
ncbi:Pollen Ole e 1 allergen and extensin family protein [Prunus dulcis]|uniref:Pollen Ole e 1 allergen and extensin family protein n=1 Tax=Prunus dulcis TaxID=3755 RepID=A0A4Y1QN10_PRUDU|nr:Pollen Ole e 1 allergen and extensin family protein [Prunus dulcis]